jgi:hypothetical protein
MEPIRIVFRLACFFFFALIFKSCEEPYVPPVLNADQQIVVEGFIEAGQETNPTFILVTKSVPFTSKIDGKVFESLFVRNASVSVFDGKKMTALTQLCLNQLPPAIKKEAAKVLGLNADSITTDICVYVDLLDQIDRRIGGKYDLTVKVGDQTLTSTTTIPPHVKLDSIRWSDPPGEPSDTLARLWVTIADRPEKNFYRYFTDTDENGYIPNFTSVTDDAFFNGKKFEFPLNRAQGRQEEFDLETSGYFYRGDSVKIKWCNIDEAHFQFWNTRDFAANSGGPFSGYTRIKTNIKGGLGIWGGYSVSTYSLFCPKK